MFCDIPHLIKLLRNHVLDSGILLPCGEVLNKDIYMELLAKDMSEYQILHKVTVHKHINIFGAERQRVRPAFQTLSHSVATAFKIAMQKKEIGDFVEKCDKFFNVMNSQQQFDCDKFRCGFGVHFEEQYHVLEDFKNTVKT